MHPSSNTILSTVCMAYLLLPLLHLIHQCGMWDSLLRRYLALCGLHSSETIISYLSDLCVWHTPCFLFFIWFTRSVCGILFLWASWLHAQLVCIVHFTSAAGSPLPFATSESTVTPMKYPSELLARVISGCVPRCGYYSFQARIQTLNKRRGCNPSTCMVLHVNW